MPRWGNRVYVHIYIYTKTGKNGPKNRHGEILMAIVHIVWGYRPEERIIYTHTHECTARYGDRMRRSSRYNTRLRFGVVGTSIPFVLHDILACKMRGSDFYSSFLRTARDVLGIHHVHMHTTAYNTIIIIKGPADIWTDPKE